MEPKQCFNCRYLSFRPEDFVLHSNQRQPLEEYISYNGLKALFGGKRPTICADCVYDRLQNCHRCFKKAPLSFYNIEEWFKTTNDRVCQDCMAVQATQVAFRNGLMLQDTLNQCFECSAFKSVYSFLFLYHIKQFDAICKECHIHKDISWYQVDLKARYTKDINSAPSLTQVKVDLNLMAKPVVSYASVLREGQKALDNDNASDKTAIVELLSVQYPSEEPPSFFQTTMDVNICRMVLNAFRKSLNELEGKTRLELQILHQDPSIWEVVLRSKLLQVSQRFSSQATNRTSFFEAEIRSAYIGTYCSSHASLVRAAVMSGCFPPLTQFVSNSNETKSQLHVCCVGAGPGSEVLGLHELLPSNTQWYLLDNCKQWSHSAQLLLRNNIPGINFNYGLFDITARFQHADLTSPIQIFKKATLYAFVKFVSAIHFLKKSIVRFRELLRLTPPGSMFLFVDNAHHRVTRFIENVVFPDGQFTEHKSCRESQYYTLYTCYAELHPTENIMESSYVTELVSLVKSWLDRTPLLDFHVNVFLLVKKANRPQETPSQNIT